MNKIINKIINKISLGLCTVALLGIFSSIEADARVQNQSDDIFYVDSWSGFQRNETNLPVDAYIGDGYYSCGSADLSVVITAINEAHGDESEDKYHQGYPEGSMKTAFQMMMDGWLPADCYYMMFDFGYYTEYVDYFKTKGWISPSYQLPDTFYTMETKKDYSKPYVFYYCGTYTKLTSYSYTHATDCKYLAEYNNRQRRLDSTPVHNYEITDHRNGLGEYIPKSYLEDNGLLGQPLPYIELLKNWIGNSAKFNAYDYYMANPELQEKYGPDPIALYYYCIEQNPNLLIQ